MNSLKVYGLIKESLAALAIIAVAWSVLTPAVVWEDPGNIGLPEISGTYYYLDYACVVFTRNASTGYFDAPINYSDGEVNQTVQVLYLGGSAKLGNNASNPYEMMMGNGTCGFIALKVSLKYRNVTEVIYNVSANPYAFKGAFNELPQEIIRKYVKTPSRLVNTTVREAFENWLVELGYSPLNVSRAFIALAAAEFIYGQHFIKYSASALPRSLADVIENRTGDCDDMSRVLLNLLWSYGIPAKMEYAYVYLPYNNTFDVEGSFINFVNAGPHAFVVSYFPGVGWVSLDFLAGALIFNPSLITGESLQANVTHEEVVQTSRELQQYRYAEVVMMYSSTSLPEKLKFLLNNQTSIGRYLRTLVEPYLKRIEGNITGINGTATQPIPPTNTTSSAGNASSMTGLPPSRSPFTPKAMLIASSIALLATTFTILWSSRKGVSQ